MTKILVTGATGSVGSRVVQELKTRDVYVRALARDAQRAAGMLGDRVEIVSGDFGDAVSLRTALAGVDAVFLACSNQPRQVEYETRMIDEAKAAGVRRIVKLSALGAEIDSPVAFWDWHGRIEEHLRTTGLPAVILRPAFSMANLLGSAEAIGQTGMLFLPAGGARVAMIDPWDVAAAATGALTDDRHDGNTYTLTGPGAITFDRVAESLSSVTGRHVQFVSVPDEAALQGMTEQGLPEFVAAQIVAVFGILRGGAQGRTTGTVQALTGHEPRGFTDFASEYAGLFAAPVVQQDEQEKASRAS